MVAVPDYVDKLVHGGQLTERQAERWRGLCRQTGHDPDAFDFGLADWVRPWTPREWEAWLRTWKQRPHTIRQTMGPAVRFGMRQLASDFPPAIVPSHIRQKVLGAVSGYLGAVDGLENGRANPGPKLRATPDQREAVTRLRNEGKSLRTIAYRVFGDVRYKDRVSRCLRRSGE
jgi:hypothetical protein